MNQNISRKLRLRKLHLDFKKSKNKISFKFKFLCYVRLMTGFVVFIVKILLSFLSSKGYFAYNDLFFWQFTWIASAVWNV
jgi:uncharacterized membrane protein YiaA